MQSQHYPLASTMLGYLLGSAAYFISDIANSDSCIRFNETINYANYLGCTTLIQDIPTLFSECLTANFSRCHNETLVRQAIKYGGKIGDLTWSSSLAQIFIPQLTIISFLFLLCLFRCIKAYRRPKQLKTEQNEILLQDLNLSLLQP